MTRKEELEMIASMKNFVRDDAAVDKVAEWYHKSVNGRDKFALHGSQWDAISDMPELVSSKGVQRSLSSSVDPDLIALVTSAMFRCSLSSCKHVWSKLAIVRHVFLAPRICSCQPCILTFIDEFKKHDESRAHAGKCDLCLTDGLSEFYESRFAYNGAIFYGDLCRSCKTLAMKQ